METVKLITPTAALETEFRAMLDDYRQAGEYHGIHAGAEEDFSAYLRRLEDHAQGIGLPQRFVPQTVYWLARDGRTLLGDTRLRHRLSPWLEVEGGHIGYAIRPGYRCQGYGTLLLRLTLEKARELGLERVFLTCDTDNLPSVRVIEKNGGVLSAKIISSQTGKMISQYWIDL